MPKTSLSPRAVVLGTGLALAVLLTLLVWTGWTPLAAFDDSVVQRLNAVMAAGPGGVELAGIVSAAGSSGTVEIVTAVALVLSVVLRRYRVTIYLLACWALEYIVENGLKHAVGRERPVVPVELAYASGGSFPSGHTMGTTVLWVSLAVVLLPVVARAWWRVLVVAVAGVVIVAVAASRVLLGMHFPSDVVGGVLWGLLVALALLPLLRMLRLPAPVWSSYGSSSESTAPEPSSAPTR